MFIRKLFFFIVVNGLLQGLLAQTEKVSPCLNLIPLTASTFIHSCNYNNGLVYISNDEALIVSTPDSEIETQHLIDWLRKEKKAKIVGCVIDRWHPDAMGGLKTIHKNGIRSYSSELTRKIAKEKKLPIPNVGFPKRLTLAVGGEKVVCSHLGEAHTRDGIVVWIPFEKILFGGNEIRNNNGWIGNIADANLEEWSNTARKIKENYGNVRFVVPGHGDYGDSELIDYTMKLYNFPKNESCSYDLEHNVNVNDKIDDFHFKALSKIKLSEAINYIKTKVVFKKSNKQIEIVADTVKYDMLKRGFFVPSCCIRLKEENNVVSFSFNKLYCNRRDDAVGLTLVIKQVKRTTPY